MHGAKCPKCQSSEIVDAVPLDDHGTGRPISVAREAKPDALIFKDRHATELTARVCQGCGYTELYAKYPRMLTP